MDVFFSHRVDYSASIKSQSLTLPLIQSHNFLSFPLLSQVTITMWTISKAVALLPILLVTCAATPRKSLEFGPNLSHRSFNTDPEPLPQHLISQGLSAKDIGELYLGYQLKLRKGSYRLREDSYLDSTTGVWHLYYRQVIFDGELEVSDGDINLSVLNGRVISYGDSVSVDYQSSWNTGRYTSTFSSSTVVLPLQSGMSSRQDRLPYPSKTMGHSTMLTTALNSGSNSSGYPLLLNFP